MGCSRRQRFQEGGLKKKDYLYPEKSGTWGNQGRERLTHLSKATQLVSGPGWADCKALTLNGNLLLPETFLDSDSAIWGLSEPAGAGHRHMSLKEPWQNNEGKVQRFGSLVPAPPSVLETGPPALLALGTVDLNGDNSSKSDSSWNSRTGGRQTTQHQKKIPTVLGHRLKDMIPSGTLIWPWWACLR